MRLVARTLVVAMLLGACIFTPAFSGDNDGTRDASPSDGAPSDGPPRDGAPDTAKLERSTDDEILVSDGCEDTDNDGYLAKGCRSLLPPDCAPDDGLIHPAAFEQCGNDADDNCSHAPAEPAGDVGACPPELQPVALFPDANGMWLNLDHFHVWFSGLDNWIIRELFPIVSASERDMIMLGGTEQSFGAMLGPDRASTSPVAAPTADTLAAGRAVYRLRVQWAAGASGELAGDTIYTVTPNGRIHVYQSLTVAPGASGDSLSTHIALNPGRVTHADWSWNTGMPYVISDFTTGLDIPTGSDTSTRQGYACAYHATNRSVMGFSWRATPATTAGGPRIIQTSQDGNHLALRFDWFRDEAVVAGTYAGHFLLYPGLTGAPGCDVVGQQSQLFRRTPNLILLDGTTAPADATSDGGFFALRAADGSHTVAFTVDTDSARLSNLDGGLLRVANFPSAYAPVVWHDNVLLEHGVDYLYQYESVTGFAWIFVQKTITNGDTLRIRAPRSP